MELTDTSVSFDGDLEKAWALLVDYKQMPSWDIFMDRLHFDAPMQLGSVGLLKMKGGPEVKLRVTSFNPPFNYTDEFSMLGSDFIFHHELAILPSKEINLRIRVESNGLFSSLLAPMMKSQFAAKMPVLMNNFKRIMLSR